MKISDCILFILLFLLMTFPGSSSGQSKELPSDRESIDKGETLFLNNCNVCHAIPVERIGPALSTVTKKRSLTWLLGFIKNSQSMITAGDTHAVFIFRSYNNTVMPSFKKLSDDDIFDILAYIQDASKTGSPKDLHPEVLLSGKYGDAILHGKFLFDQQCAVCHAFDKEVIGPALGSTPKTLPLSWLIPFVHNSQEVIKKGDIYANFISEQYDHYKMPAFTYLSENDIRDIFLYLNAKATGPVHISGSNAALNPDLSPMSKLKVDPGPPRMSFEEGRHYRRYISLNLIQGLFLLGALIHIAFIIALAFIFFRLINK
ncbi:hypothetical protein MYP_2266 [Sporocytophaga myxococcoides]|uniref:Cytochrome c domain-containing protein n=1 Tax=Sporocytophaga myxococcoides TaxID=153721 RepID=A0A098LG16_9BACT|nr:cytochrome c [Sporocytophaga myxococcoides]GAL85038.1 hypothetical protein MYP_2266 [Sporocytophaga myxococcoides]